MDVVQVSEHLKMYTYVSIENGNIGCIKKERRSKNNTFFLLARGEWMNRVNRVRHTHTHKVRKRVSETRKKPESNIVNMKEYIIIFLHMDWFIAFVPFAG